VLCNYIG